MKQQRQKFWSTKPKNVQADQLQDDNVETNITTATHRNKKIYIVNLGQERNSLHWLDWKFPMQSSQGHIYTMVMVEIDENYIDAKHMKNIIEDEMIRAHQVLL